MYEMSPSANSALAFLRSNLLFDANIETNNIESNKLQLLREMISTRRNEFKSAAVRNLSDRRSSALARVRTNRIMMLILIRAHTQIDYYAKLSNM